MEHSENINELAAALSKAQAKIKNAIKDSSNPFFKSTYADLSSVREACQEPLAENGLAVVQASDFIPEFPDMVCVETMLCHSSGQWIRGRLAVKPVKNDPQSVGSAITYLRRYSLQSMVGIAPEDDDGNAASGRGEQPKTAPKSTAQPAKTEVATPDFSFVPATVKQLQLIQIEMKNRGHEREEILKLLSGFVGRELASSKELTKQEASEWLSLHVKEAASAAN